MNESINRGIIDSGSRIMDELLQKTAFKDSLRYLLQNIDPQSAPQLVRVILGRDLEVPFSILCALPAIANSVILMVDELVGQIREKFPETLLGDFMESLLSEIDYQALARAVDGAKKLSDAMGPAFEGALTKLIRERDSLAGEAAGVLKDSPAPPLQTQDLDMASQAKE